MKLTTSKKMWFGFSAVLILLLAVSTISIFLLVTLSGDYKKIIDVDMKKVDLAEDIQVVQKDMAAAVLEFVMFGKDDAINKLDAGIEEGSGYARELIEKTKDEESLKLLEDLQKETILLFESNDKIISLKKGGGDFSSYSSNSMVLNTNILGILDDLIQIQENNSQKTRDNLENLQRIMMVLIIGISVISIIVGIAISYFMSKNIANPVKKITAGLEEVAAGNLLIEPINIKNKDEIGVMATTYNKMLMDLKGIVTDVRASSEELAASAEQLAASAEESQATSQMVTVATEHQLAMGMEQAKETELTVSVLNQLNQSVMNISNDNDKMRTATSDVQALVTKGSLVVSDVEDKMNIIHTTFNETTEIMTNMAKHSDDIQKVTSMITEISEQTNLLALNAAIEAARAGEYGNGFAVVAEEVRNLAEKSKLSAAEIEGMVRLIQSASESAVKAITSGGDKVEEGLSRTYESIQVFNEIETSVSDVVVKVNSVSGAIEEIQAMAENVTANSTRVQQLTEKATESANNTNVATEEQLATTEEISSNAQSLADIAEKLQSKVNHFKI